MKLVTQFEVFGRCVPWSIPDIAITKRGKPRFVLKDPALKAWQGHVAGEAKAAMSEAPAVLGPVMLDIEFYRETPPGKTHGDWWDVRVEKAEGQRHIKRGLPQPDLVNLFKGTEDALEGIVFGNDAQTCSIRTARLYGPKAGVRVTAYVLEPGDRPAPA